MSKSPYSLELREKIAKEYLAGNSSSVELADKYIAETYSSLYQI